MDLSSLETRAVDADNWADLEQLFEARGGPHSCWCMVWRAKPAAARQAGTPARKAILKAALHARVAGGTPIGILGYLGGEPVAWCSIAPRPSYRTLGGPADPPGDPAAVWSLTCFFAKRPLRGQGITGRLLAAAIAYARDNGARIVEAYPVDPTSPSYRYMGLIATFERAGFAPIGRAGSRRHVMRLSLD